MGLPRVNRMEYLLEFRYPDKGPDGRTVTVTDPGNPEQAPGAFGPKSVLEFPSYRPPGWLTAPADPDLSANTRYARALAGAVLPALARRLATSRRIGMGVSLDGLAMLHLTRLVGQVRG